MTTSWETIRRYATDWLVQQHGSRVRIFDTKAKTAVLAYRVKPDGSTEKTFDRTTLITKLALRPKRQPKTTK